MNSIGHSEKLLVMRIFIAALVLIFSLQSWTKADDISEFEIEGISIGDSLLDYFNKNEIENEKYSKYSFWYKNNKYVAIGAGGGSPLDKKLDNYDDLSIVLKQDDNTYKIYSVGGRIFCENINTCKTKKNEIVKELKLFFDDEVSTYSDDSNHVADPTGNSKAYSVFFNFKKNKYSYVEVSVYDWSKEMDYPDNLKVVIYSEEFGKFIENEAYE